MAGDVNGVRIDAVRELDEIDQPGERFDIGPDLSFRRQRRHHDEWELRVVIEPLRQAERADFIDLAAANRSAVEVQKERPAPAGILFVIGRHMKEVWELHGA
ncbi:MAG: hypothetical protein H0W20_06710 [Chthoniobacterales bacterium]|nr:hypothetical protein [Chthoniobacterales bacterium]